MLYIGADLFKTNLLELEPYCSKSPEETVAANNDYKSALHSVLTNGNLSKP